MFLENVVIDALDPQLVGRFWEAALGCEQLTDEPGIYETRLAIEGGPALDLCFQQVPEPASATPRLHVDLVSGRPQAEDVERLIALGARHLESARGHLPWVVLADPEGNPCRVLEDHAAYAETGPLAAIALDSADPDRDAAFWSWLTGWTDASGVAPHTLRHPSLRGPLLELRPEPAAKGTTKNRWHLDVRLEPGEDPDAVEGDIVQRGGRPLGALWGDLPWRSYLDPSGNEFCVLPASS